MLGHCNVMGICLPYVFKMSYVPLNAENCLQSVKIKSKFYMAFFFFFFFFFCCFFYLDGKKWLHIV